VYTQVGIEYIYSGLPVTTTVAGYNGATAANATYANYGKVSTVLVMLGVRQLQRCRKGC
jgi:hypothetical protein